MEESKRKEIREYLESQVNPIIRPLVEEIVRKRPSNIPSFINEYTFKMMSNSHTIQTTATSATYTLTQRTSLKKLRPNYCVGFRRKRRRKWKRRTAVKASAPKCSGSSTRKANSPPKLFPKTPPPARKSSPLLKRAFSLATSTRKTSGS